MNMKKKNERQPFLLLWTIIYAMLLIIELVLVNLQDHHCIDLPRWLLFSPTIIILIVAAFNVTVSNIRSIRKEESEEEE